MSGLIGLISGVITTIVKEITTQDGGLPNLISRFDSAGLGPQAQSWVSTSDNQPLSPTHITHVFSDWEIKEWADRAGIQPEELHAILADKIPEAVNQATPEGAVPPPEPVVNYNQQAAYQRLRAS